MSFFSEGYQIIDKKETVFFRHLLGQPARADGRDPAKITGRFRANFRLAMCTSQLKINLLSWCTDFFFSGGRSQAAQRKPPQDDTHPPKVGGSSLGYAYFS